MSGSTRHEHHYFVPIPKHYCWDTKNERSLWDQIDSKDLWFSFPGEFHLRLRHLEKSLLQALNDAKGRILDDDRIIATLEKLKQEAAEITRKVEETDAVMAEVEAVSDQYNALSHYCSSIYFTMEGLKLVRHRNLILNNKKSIVRQRPPKLTVNEFCKMF